jgi:hypothetical protein
MSNFFTELDEALSSCRCGLKTKSNFYGDDDTKRALSPTRLDVLLGFAAYLALVIVLALIAPLAVDAVILGLTVGLILALAAARMVKHHQAYCSVRWALINIFGLGRWLSVY